MKKPESILALDLGSSYIKLIEAEVKGSRPFIKNYSVTPVPAELREVESVNTPAYIDFIKKLISEKGITAENAIVCISHPQLEVKNLVLPAMSPKEIKTGIEWQIKDVLSTPLEEAVIDYMVQGDFETPEGKKMELCIAAIPKKIAGEYSSLLKELNIVPLAFVLEPQSAWHALKDCNELKDKKTIALINMGAEKTIVSVYSGSKLKLMRALPISSNRFTGSIASRVVKTNGESIDVEKAEFIKCKYGIPVLTGVTEEGVNYQDIFSALRPSLEDMVSELTRFLEYYRSEHEGESIEIIAVYGGASKLLGISDYISKNIGLPVVSPNPVNPESIEVIETQKEELEKHGPFLVNAIGAVIVKDNAVNLLPSDVKAKKKQEYEKGVWFKARIGFIVAVFAVYMVLSFAGWMKQMALTRLKNDYEKLAGRKEELYRYNAMVNEYNSKTKLANKLIRDEPFWEDLFKELANLVPDNIIIGEFGFNPSNEISQRGIALPLIITGVVIPRDSPPQEDLTKFLQNMEKSKYFRKIKLEYSKEAKYKEEKVLEFKIGCDLK